MAISPTVRLGSFDTLPVAGTRRRDGERDGRGIRQGTCASGRWAALELHASRAEVDHAEYLLIKEARANDRPTAQAQAPGQTSPEATARPAPTAPEAEDEMSAEYWLLLLTFIVCVGIVAKAVL